MPESDVAYRSATDLSGAIAEGRVSPVEVMEETLRRVSKSLVLHLAGWLLILPGPITDVFGTLLLIQPLRAGLVRWAGPTAAGWPFMNVSTSKEKSYDNSSGSGKGSRGRHRSPPVRDASFEVIEDELPDD